MYTEYVFENKKYEVASREIKATLFDIVSAEEEKIAQLREKAFVDTTDPKKAADLQNLYVQQDACLREILSISENLTSSLQRVDSCSRKLKQIEDKNIAQIIANIKEVEEPQPVMMSQPVATQEEMTSTQSYNDPVMVSSPNPNEDYSNTLGAAMAPEPVDEPVLDQPVGIVHEVMDDVPAVAEETPVEVVHEVMDVPEGEMNPTEEPKEDIIHEVMDIPEGETTSVDPQIVAKNDHVVEIPAFMATPNTTEEAAPEVAEEVPVITEEAPVMVEEAPVISTDVPVITEEMPVVEESQPVIAPSEETVVEEGPVMAEGETQPLIIPTEETSSEGEAVISEETPSQPLIPNEEAPVTTEVIPTDTITETTSAPVIVPTTDAVTETMPIDETVSEPLIVPETEVAPVIEGESASVSENDSEPMTIPTVTVSSDGPLEAVTGSGLEEDQTTSTVEEMGGIPEMVPEVSEMTNTTTDTNTQPLEFHKRTADAPKVIMISGKQATKLRQSLPTQEALLSAKGFFNNEEGLEQQLVDNGLLEPDFSTKQAQIEQMMNQANELYAAGKVEEAQNMYNQISELNKELQEKVGVAKA